MAANLNSRGIANLGKRLVCSQQIWTTHSTLKRALHTSFYEKNIDDLPHHAVVPDEVIQPQSEKYWAPHPQTGVFGPAAAQPATSTATAIATATRERYFHSSLEGTAANGGSDNTESVLEQKAWFRPTSIEDLEKPHNLH